MPRGPNHDLQLAKALKAIRQLEPQACREVNEIGQEAALGRAIDRKDKREQMAKDGREQVRAMKQLISSLDGLPEPHRTEALQAIQRASRPAITNGEIAVPPSTLPPNVR